MATRRTILLTLLFLVFTSAAQADDKARKGPEITDKMFRQTSSLLLDDPLKGSARDWARLIMLYTLQSRDVNVVLGKEELRWAGVDKDARHSLLLLAAYSAGNIQSQLNSGVKRNDRYSGLLTLFRVYRALRSQDRQFELAAIDELLALHEANGLTRHLQQLEGKQPAKSTAAEERIIRELMRTR